MAKEIQKAAIKCGYKIYTGFEHGECFKQIEDCDKDSETIQGFVTNDGDFVNRHEAMVIAKIAGQLQYEMDKETLISEDLHVDWLHKQEKLISKLQSELDYTKKSIEIFKITNDALRQENLDLSYNQVDNAYELAKEMSENWERNYQQEILELKERLANCIEPKFVVGQKIYVIGTENVEEVEYFGENIDGIITFEEGCRCGCTPDRYSVEKRENVFATEEEAKAKLEELQGE